MGTQRERTGGGPSDGAGAGALSAAGIRPRVLVLVLLSQAVIIAWVASSEIATGVYLICYSLMMPTALYLVLARLLRRWLPLDDRELLLGYIVLTATVPIIGFGGLRFVITGMGYLPYIGEFQPQYSRFLPAVARLPVLHDGDAVRGLYLGAEGIPWGAWAAPIVFWSGYLLLLSLTWLCLAGVLRRIWIHQERLSFPVAVLPLQMMDRHEHLFRRPVFWIGFAIPAILQSLLAIHSWVPSVPAVQLKATNVAPLLFTTFPWNAIDSLMVGFYPMAIGLAFFVPGDVSFSCWFFAILSKLSFAATSAMGLEPMSGAGRFPYVQEQAAGAWIGFAGIILWGARRHWRTVFASVDAAERRTVKGMALTAFAALLACCLLMAIVGIPLWVALGVVVIYASYVLTGARVRAEAGAMWTFAPLLTPHRVMNTATAAQGMDTRALAASGYFDLVHVDIRAQSLPYLMEGMDIAEKVGIRWRAVLVWVALGTLTALAMGWWSTLHTLYDVGAATAKANPYPLVKTQIAFTEVERLSSAGVPWSQAGASAMGFAACFTLVLAVLRRLEILGLHPLGYVLCNTLTMNSFIVPFFIAWAAKTLVLRFGGGEAYRRTVPFFVGVVLGDVLTQAAWAVVGSVFDVPIYQFLT